MADHIKFQCKSCGKKMAVRAEYAGKKARCTGCKQPVRVPSPRPKRAATGAPVTVGTGSSGHMPADDDSTSMSLEELAAMEQAATGSIAELTSKAGARSGAPQVKGGKPCPSCGSSIKQDAVICIHCGHNFNSGKQLKTKKLKAQKEKGPGASTGSSGGGGVSAGLNNLGTFIAGGIFVVLGIGVIFYDWDLSESSGRKGRWVATLFNTLGPVPAGCILIGIGAIVALFAFTGSRD